MSGLVERAIARECSRAPANVRGRSSGFTARRRDPRDGCAVYRHAVPAPRRYVTEAIVLSRFDYGEADRILTLITPGGGKIKAIAKGIRRPDSRGSAAASSRSPSCGSRSRRAGRSRSSPRSRSSTRGCGCATTSCRSGRRRTWRSSPTARSRSATARSPCTCCSSAPTRSSTPGWRPGGSPAGSRCTSPTSWACGPRSTAASSAAGCSRPTSATAGCRRSAACCASAARARRSSAPASRSSASSC